MGNVDVEFSDSVMDEKVRAHKPSKARKGLLGWINNEFEYLRTSLAGIDNMWIPLTGGPNDFNPVCSGIFTFAEEVSVEALMRTWDEMTQRYPRYRQKLVGVGRKLHSARLVDNPFFNVRDHVIVERLPDNANGKHALEDAMATFMAKTWDLEKPLWEAKVLYNYRDGTGAKCALIVRAHHTLSDGQGFVISQLTTTSARDVIEKKLAQAASKENKLKKGRAKISDLPMVGKQLRTLDPFVPSLVVSALFFSFWAMYIALGLVLDTWTGLRVIFKYLTFRPRALAYDGPRPAEKEFSFSEAVSMADIKLVQKAFQSPGRHITLNDVMCAVVAKTIHSYIKQVGETPDRRIAMFIPISVRTASNHKMENQSTGLTAYFRASTNMSSQALIDATHDEMAKIKRTIWPRIIFKLLNFVLRVPAFIPANESWSMQHILTGFHAVLTNVPGPGTPIDIEGAEVLRWTASPPQAGKGVLGLGILSYNGHLIWTVTADRKPGYHEDIAHKLTDGFYATFNQFLDEARQIIKD